MSALAVADTGDGGDGQPVEGQTPPVQSVESQSVSLSGIDIDDKHTMSESDDSNAHTSGKSTSQQQTGVTGEVKKLTASNLSSSKPLVNNHPLAKDNMVNKSNETVSEVAMRSPVVFGI